MRQETPSVEDNTAVGIPTGPVFNSTKADVVAYSSMVQMQGGDSFLRPIHAAVAEEPDGRHEEAASYRLDTNGLLWRVPVCSGI